MSSTHEIIALLQARIARPPSTDLQCEPPIVPRPVLSDEAIGAAEAEMGIRLPALVRDLYLHVADGGYGPGWGIASLDEIVEWDRDYRSHWDDMYPPAGWPDTLIRFCEWGCNIWSGLDCSSERCAVIRFDPDRDVTEIAEHLVPECDSLAEWLTAWLDGTLSFRGE